MTTHTERLMRSETDTGPCVCVCICQYLDNGNMVVNFAGVEPDSHPFYTEVTRKGEKVLELSINPGRYNATRTPMWLVQASLSLSLSLAVCVCRNGVSRHEVRLVGCTVVAARPGVGRREGVTALQLERCHTHQGVEGETNCIHFGQGWGACVCLWLCV